MTTGTTTTRPRRRPHRHRERLARERANVLVDDMRHVAGPEGAGWDAKARVRDGDWDVLERRKKRLVGELMEAPAPSKRWRTSAGGHAARPLPVGTPSSGITTYTITLEQHNARHERREPVSLGLPPLTLPRSFGTAYQWMMTAGEAQSEPQGV